MGNIEQFISKKRESKTFKSSSIDVIDQIKAAMLEYGITPPDYIDLSSCDWVRFDKNGGNGNKRPRYYKFDTINGIIIGCFGCWSDDIRVGFRENIGRELSPLEKMQIDQAQKRLEAEQKQLKEAKREEAITTIREIWQSAEPAPLHHKYLDDKKIHQHHCKIKNNQLLMPLYNIDNELTSLQYISEDGSKKNASGVSTKGLVAVFEGVTDDHANIYVATGLSTSATICEQTGGTVIATIGDSNLIGGCEYAFKHYPNKKIILIADNDQKNSGQKAANKCKYQYPKLDVIIIPNLGQDANDYHNSGGDLNALINSHKPAVEPSDNDSWLVSADDFCSQPVSIKWLVKNWIPQNSLIMVHGPSGGGKTFLVLDLCCHITSSKIDWNGHIVRSGSVVYLAGEGHQGLRSRLAAWKQHNQEKSLGEFYLSRGGCNLNSVEGLTLVTNEIDKLPAPPALIVVDTLHRFLDGDENTAKDAKTMLDACAELTYKYGSSVLLVHHTGVDKTAQDRARGSSAWRGALDIEISVAPNGDNIEFHQRKNKDAELAKSKAFSLDSVDIDGWFDEDGEQVTSAVVVQGSISEKPKKDTAASKNLKILGDAWLKNGGGELLDSRPYITKSALTDYLVNDGRSAAAIRQQLKPSFERGIIGCLLANDLIAAEEHGWIITDEDQITALNLINIASK